MVYRGIREPNFYHLRRVVRDTPRVASCRLYMHAMRYIYHEKMEQNQNLISIKGDASKNDTRGEISFAADLHDNVYLDASLGLVALRLRSFKNDWSTYYTVSMQGVHVQSNRPSKPCSRQRGDPLPGEEVLQHGLSPPTTTPAAISPLAQRVTSCLIIVQPRRLQTRWVHLPAWLRPQV